MTAPLAIDSFTRVDPGRVRSNNEDAAGGFEPPEPEVRRERGCLYLVADGMGGQAAGEVASGYALEKILHAYYSLPWEGPEHTLAVAIRQANADIHDEGSRNELRRGMGSTVVAAAVFDRHAVIANVGDSRAYLLRDGLLVQLTRDHSWVAERLVEGTITPEQAAEHPNRNLLTRNLGSRPDVDPEIITQPLQRGDRLLLCSDGLWNVLPEERIAALAATGNAERAVAALVGAANAAGGADNIGVALVHIGSGRGATTRRLPALPDAPTWQARRPPPPTRRIALPALLRRDHRPITIVTGLVAILLAGGSLIAYQALISSDIDRSNMQYVTPTAVETPAALSRSAATSNDAQPDGRSVSTSSGASTSGLQEPKSRCDLGNATPVGTGATPYCVQAGDHTDKIVSDCASQNITSEAYKKEIRKLNPQIIDLDKISASSIMWLPIKETLAQCYRYGISYPLPSWSSTTPRQETTQAQEANPRTTTARVAP